MDGNNAGHTILSVSGSTIGMIPTLFFCPLFAITKTVMYFNLCVEKEGLNAKVLLHEMGEHGDGIEYRGVSLLDDGESKTEMV